MILRKGDQVAYVPPHAQQRNGPYGPQKYWRTWDPEHPDVEFGFVMCRQKDSYFCRYWIKGQPGTLRTVANSERTPAWCLVQHDSVKQEIVEATLAKIERGE